MYINEISFTDLPTPPDSLLAVIRYCSEDDTTAKGLAGLIKLEPMLTAELLKIVNSAYYGFVSEISSIEHMTVMMGLKSIRSLALCIAMRDISKDKNIKGFDDTLFWEDSIRRGVISSVLGKELNLDADDCFTAGLLQDIGLLILFAQDDEHGSFVNNYRVYNPDLREVLEQDEFSVTHDEVANFLKEQWSLPEILVNAISNHHQKNTKEIGLQAVLYCTDWLNALFTLSDKDGVYQRCQELMKQQFNFNQEQITNILTMLPNEIEAIGEALGQKININDDLVEIMLNGTQKLAEHNLELQELTWRLKQTIAERNKLSDELQREVKIAKDVQTALLPSYNSNFPIHAFNVPAGELSGDFYDYFCISNYSVSEDATAAKKIFFCLGDVSGKGVYASLLMVKTSSLFRSLCINNEVELSDIAEKMNNELCRIVVRGMFVTMLIGVYEPHKNIISFVNAGHPPAFYLSKLGESTQYAAQSPPLGILPEQTYQHESVSLNDGCFYIYSDGVTEAQIKQKNGSYKMLGVEGLEKLLQRLNGKAASERLQAILNSFQRSQTQLHDDTTMLLINGLV